MKIFFKSATDRKGVGQDIRIRTIPRPRAQMVVISIQRTRHIATPDIVRVAMTIVRTLTAPAPIGTARRVVTRRVVARWIENLF